MSTPHFHTSVSSTRHFHTSATPFQTPKFPHKSVISIRHFNTNPLLQNKSVTLTRHFNTNPWRVESLSKWLIRVEVSCRGDELALKWRVEVTNWMTYARKWGVPLRSIVNPVWIFSLPSELHIWEIVKKTTKKFITLSLDVFEAPFSCYIFLMFLFQEFYNIRISDSEMANTHGQQIGERNWLWLNPIHKYSQWKPAFLSTPFDHKRDFFRYLCTSFISEKIFIKYLITKIFFGQSKEIVSFIITLYKNL